MDNEKIELPCECGHKVTETIGRLKRNPHLTCPRCRAKITVDLRELNKTIKRLEADLERISKTINFKF